MALLLFFLPGLLALRWADFNKRGLAERFCLVIGLSMSFYAASALPLKYLNISLTGYIYLVFLFSVMLLFAFRKKILSDGNAADRTELIIFLVFIALIFARTAPLLIQPLPAGQEAARSAYSARLIFENDRVQSDSSGSELIAAALSIVGGAEPQYSTFFMFCFSYVLLSFSLYLMLTGLYKRHLVAAASILAVSLFAWPQDLIGSGESLLAFYFSFLLISFSLMKGGHGRPSGRRLALAAVPLIAAFSGWHVLFTTKGLLMLLLLPLSLAISAVLKKLGRYRSVWMVLIVFAVVNYLIFYLYISVSRCPVTRADLEAFEWIDQTVNRKAVFLVNESDAGVWIPAVTGRSIQARRASYIYIGAKRLGAAELSSVELEGRPSRYRRVYMNGGAQVWKIL